MSFCFEKSIEIFQIYLSCLKVIDGVKQRCCISSVDFLFGFIDIKLFNDYGFDELDKGRGEYGLNDHIR